MLLYHSPAALCTPRFAFFPAVWYNEGEVMPYEVSPRGERHHRAAEGAVSRRGCAPWITIRTTSCCFAVRLAAQCTDARVNQVTPALFARFPTLEAFAAGRRQEEVGEYVRSCGFWRAKARDMVAGGKNAAVGLRRARCRTTWRTCCGCPGVGRKTANLILGDVYGQAGYVCDTHCIRITGRLGLTDGSQDPVQVERQLRRCIPPEESSDFCHRMVLHGRAVCMARRPDCGGCALRDLCDFGKAQETV